MLRLTKRLLAAAAGGTGDGRVGLAGGEVEPVARGQVKVLAGAGEREADGPGPADEQLGPGMLVDGEGGARARLPGGRGQALLGEAVLGGHGRRRRLGRRGPRRPKPGRMCRLGSAPTSRGVRSPRSRAKLPAQATMAPLSVHRAGEGTSRRIPRSSDSAARRARRRELAATPPPSSTVSRPSRLATPTTLLIWTSTTASWNEAAMSATLRSGPADRTWRSTAVLSPEKEKSSEPSSSRALGNRTAAGSPSRARRSITGPPG